jgi:predicted cupin superfamily sugar epimerase
LKKISGPLLDRIDININVPRLAYGEINIWRSAMKKVGLLLIAAMLLFQAACYAGDLDGMTAEEVVKALNLQPLSIEGGYFRECFVASEKYLHRHLPPRFDGDRYFGGAIYFLITADSHSPFHKLNNNEVWALCAGDAAVQTIIDRAGTLKQTILGKDIQNGQSLMGTIPAESWQSTRLIPGGKWALYILTTAPNFEYSDYTGASDSDIIKKYPQYEKVLAEFCRK